MNDLNSQITETGNRGWVQSKADLAYTETFFCNGHLDHSLIKAFKSVFLMPSRLLYLDLDLAIKFWKTKQKQKWENKGKEK